MGDVLAIPLHLAVHVSGFGLAAGLAAYAVVRRHELGSTWTSLAAGALLLGVSSVVFGGQFAQGDAWPMYVRAAGYAGLAFGVVGRGHGHALVLAPAVPVASQYVAAATGALAALATLGGALGRGRQVWLLSLGLGLLAAGDVVGSAQPTLGAAVSLVGAVTGLTWLAQRTGRTLVTRFISLFTAVLLLLVLVLASASAVVFDQNLEADRLDLLAQQADARVAEISREVPDELARTLELLAGSQGLPAALAEDRGSDAVAANVADIVQRADLLVLTDASGAPVGSFDRSTGGSLGPTATTVAGLELVERARVRQAATDDLVRIELLDTGVAGPELLAVAVRPLFPTVDGTERRDQLAGTVVAASRLTRVDRLEQISRETGAEVAVIAGGQLAGATTGQDAQLDADLADLEVSDGGQVVELAGRPTFVQVTQITDAEERPVGALVLFEDATVVAGLERTVTRWLFLAAVLGGLLATVLAAGVTARAIRPVRRLTDAAEQIADGDLSVEVEVDRDDEVGRLAGAFSGMATALGHREDDLRTSARREATLRQRLEAVTSSMDQGLLAVDADGTVGLANPAMARLLDRDVTDLLGQPVDAVLAGSTEDGTSWSVALGEVGTMETRAARGTLDVSDGRGLTVDGTAAPLLTDDGRPGRVVVLRDVTAEAEMDRVKDEFVSNAAHELRTPLTYVVGSVGSLRRRPDMDAGRRDQLVEAIADGADQLARIVDQLVWFADLESGRARVEPVPTCLSDLVDESLSTWRARHPDRTFRRRLARGLPDVLVDPAWTRRALDEVLANAVKFSDDRIVVGATRDDGRVRLEVRDQGPGIPEEAMDSIRTAFRQADGSVTRHHGGLGLGLAIVEEILDHQDADLALVSHVGQGTHVGFLLPTA